MLEIRILGQFDVRLDGKPVEMRSQPLRLLLAYLALNAGQSIPREKIAGVLWPDTPEGAARKNLRNYVWQLRRLIGERYLAADRNTLSVAGPAPYRIDAAMLEQENAALGTEALIATVSVYRGELLPGHYDDWVQLERGRLRALFERWMEILLGQLADQERWSTLVTWSEHWIAYGESPEPAYRSLMIGYAGLGDQAGMATSYLRCKTALKENLSVEPSAVTQMLFERLSRGEQPIGEGSVSFSDEPKPGDHRQPTEDSSGGALVRAADRDETEESHALPERSVPLPLPAYPNSFVGREAELDTLKRLLKRSRLLTLTGVGGTGKTRLALEVAGQVQLDYRDGVAFVGLASLDDPALVIESIALTLGVQEVSGEPRLAALKRFLAPKQLLLLLDNFEHVRAAGPEVAELLVTASGLTLLATSRESLHLYGEQTFPVPTLAHALPEKASPAAPPPAALLFADRARAVAPAFKLDEHNLPAIIQICALLDGLPLAIELAAARTRLFSAVSLLAQLQGAGGEQNAAPALRLLSDGPLNMPARQQTLRATIDWSYHLLTFEEQALFRRLAVFRGGGDLAAVQAICASESGPEPERRNETIELLSSLCDKSVLHTEEGVAGKTRFWMLRMIREYAGERLERSRERPAIGERHARYYLGLAESAEEELLGSGAKAWMSRLEQEHDNIRAALRWTLQQERLDLALPAAVALSRFWRQQDHVGEGRRWVELLLEASREAPGPLRMSVLMAAGALAMYQDDLGVALSRYQRALTIAQEVGDQRSIVTCLFLTGVAHLTLGDRGQAKPLMEESLRQARRLPESEATGIIAEALLNLVNIALFERDYARVEQLQDEALARARAGGHPWYMAVAAGNRARLEADLGHYEEARVWLDEALRQIRELSDSFVEAGLVSFAGTLALRTGALPEAAAAYASALGTYAGLNVFADVAAYCLEGLALVAAVRAQDKRAALLWGAAELFRAGIAQWPVEQEDQEQAMKRVRARTVPAAFDHAWAKGRQMAQDARQELIAYAVTADTADPPTSSR